MKSIILLLLFSLPCLLFSQYLETFSTAGMGIEGACTTSSPSSCATHEFAGVTWKISGDASSVDLGDSFITSSGVLRGEDIDEELCWESPTLDIDIGGNVSISVDVSWVSYDISSDYIDLEYSIDGGSYVQAPNYFSGLTSDHTVDGGVTSGGNGSGSRTLNVGGLSGMTLDVRVCADFNSVSEVTTIDNVSVPEAGVELQVLPVVWGDMAIKNHDGQIELNWATLSELNNHKFEIFRSHDNQSWRNIGQVDGAGSSQNRLSYSFTDEHPLMGKSSYQIRQIDFNGKGSMSSIMEVEVLPNEFRIEAVYPNPTNGLLSIRSQSPKAGKLFLQLFDLKGKEVYRSSERISEGFQDSKIDLSTLPMGGYYLRASLQEQTRNIYLIKN